MYSDPSLPSVSPIQIHAERIVQLLQNIQAHKTSGPNNLPACFLKGVANEIAFVLTIISQATLD